MSRNHCRICPLRHHPSGLRIRIRGQGEESLFFILRRMTIPTVTKAAIAEMNVKQRRTITAGTTYGSNICGKTHKPDVGVNETRFTQIRRTNWLWVMCLLRLLLNFKILRSTMTVIPSILSGEPEYTVVRISYPLGIIHFVALPPDRFL